MRATTSLLRASSEGFLEKATLRVHHTSYHLSGPDETSRRQDNYAAELPSDYPNLLCHTRYVEKANSTSSQDSEEEGRLDSTVEPFRKGATQAFPVSFFIGLRHVRLALMSHHVACDRVLP